jgi:streptogramin lyase
MKILGLAAALALSGPGMAAPAPEILSVPGFADFITVDGDSVWVTNAGRVERWSRAGKQAEVKIPKPCGTMALTPGALWVADCGAKTISRIDTATNTITAVIPTGLASPDGEMNVVSGAGSVWVASDAKGVVSRIDPATNKVVATAKVEPGSCYLAFGLDALWVVSAASQTLQKVDPATNSAVWSTKLGKAPGFLAAGEGSVWVQEQGDGTLARIDPKSGAITGRTQIDKTLKWGDIDTGSGKVWLRTTLGQTFVVVAADSLAILARIGPAEGSGALRYTPAGIWTSAHDVHTLTFWPQPEAISNATPGAIAK